ncbi:DUF3143 domain-containing protein [Synechococcus sp. GFB01]|uniref:DUF3143 domain-containing protein n=1 Tax=Synechococcus sp. GFB01 TaxID=1662190 RepID=UPI00064FC83E|nr:DUF3143 domain-containing protein [Synechococcus sp. GFB01]KMM17296.1 hypothetical protein SYNGFB01_04890 [Synechococcus sp. GFB01]
MSELPSARTPLYNHPLPALEHWLRGLGAVQQPENLCIWDLRGPSWTAEIELEIEELRVSWHQQGRTVARHFPYGLSRADAEAAILAGP